MKFKREIFSWALYDWANSAFSTTVMAGFFPVFFKEYWSQGTDASTTTARLGLAISLGSIAIAIISPTLGALADLGNQKKKFCFLFMLLGAAAVSAMAFICEGQWVMAVLAYGVAMVGFNASCVFYDSLLPSVASHEQMDFVSAWGYALGYLGGGCLFTLNVAMYLSPATFGLSSGADAIKVSFLSVGIWWLLFSIPLFLYVPEIKGVEKKESLWILTLQAVHSLNHTLYEIFKNKNILFFILAFWFYIDGVYTVMSMAVDFGISIGFKAADLITALLITQFIGFPMAWFFGFLSSKYSSRHLIFVCLAGYSFVLTMALMMTQTWHFYALAFLIGCFQGGVQGLSRSLFAKMIPVHKSAEYFGFFNLIGKFAAILGPLIVGAMAVLTGDHRQAMLGILILFILGAVLLWRVKEPLKST